MIKEKFILLLRAIFLFLVIVDAKRVKGHWRDTDRDGVKDTWIQPYNRSNKNDSTWDNYSTKGNINPWTGKKGTKDPYNDDKSYSNPFGNSNKQKGYDYDNPFKKHKSPYDD